jgi:hypothetical protein
MSEREPIEPPGGFGHKSRPDSAPEVKPDWLVGADDGLDFKRPDPDAPRPSLSRPLAPMGETPPPPRRPVRPSAPQRPAATGRPAASQLPATGEPQAPEAWTAAGSSIPKLTVVPQRERPGRGPEAEEEHGIAESLEAGLEDEEREPSDQPGSPRPPEEPWWLVATETLATNRLLQIGLGLVLAAFLLWTYWPRKGNASTSIAAIKQHPQRFEGQSVRIRGEVGEVFDVGSSVVFELRQRRDTLVVFSPSRRPTTHEHLMVQGTVSTGYLDGTPRVALFESPGATAP